MGSFKSSADAKLAVVIVAWNSGNDLCETLASVAGSSRAPDRVIVVDNGSEDGSIERVEQAFPQTQVIRVGRNLGYAGGNNLGLSLAFERGTDFVLLLNDDAVLSPDCLEILVEEAVGRPDAGLFGPLVCIREHPDTVLSAGGRLGEGWFPRYIGIGEPVAEWRGGAEEVDYLSGCALLASREFVEEVGPLDEAYFAYHEDVDWGLRARKAGFKVVAVRRALAWHPDTRKRDENSVPVTYYIARNSLMFLKKHGAPWAVRARTIAKTGRTLASWTLRPKWRYKRAQRNALLWGVLDGLSGISGHASRL